MPPSGKKVTVTAMGFSRIKDGTVVEHWGQVDFLGLLQQIGVLPSPKR
jgi:predicted ester cyclase